MKERVLSKDQYIKLAKHIGKKLCVFISAIIIVLEEIGMALQAKLLEMWKYEVKIFWFVHRPFIAISLKITLGARKLLLIIQQQNNFTKI